MFFEYSPALPIWFIGMFGFDCGVFDAMLSRLISPVAFTQVLPILEGVEWTEEGRETPAGAAEAAVVEDAGRRGSPPKAEVGERAEPVEKEAVLCFEIFIGASWDVTGEVAGIFKQQEWTVLE